MTMCAFLKMSIVQGSQIYFIGVGYNLKGNLRDVTVHGPGKSAGTGGEMKNVSAHEAE